MDDLRAAALAATPVKQTVESIQDGSWYRSMAAQNDWSELASPDRILGLLDDLDAAQRWIVSFPWARDFACADCEALRDPRASESDSIIPGFRCAWHTARAALEGKPE